MASNALNLTYMCARVVLVTVSNRRQMKAMTVKANPSTPNTSGIVSVIEGVSASRDRCVSQTSPVAPVGRDLA